MAFEKGNQLAKGNPNSGRPREWTDELIEAEAYYLLEWAQDPDALVLGECYGSRGYSYEDAMDWSNRFSVFCKCKNMAKAIVGARREKGAIKKKYDSNIVGRSMPQYDPEFKAFLKDMKMTQAVVDAIGEDAAKKLSDFLKSQSPIHK